jgi:hypothetical protein
MEAAMGLMRRMPPKHTEAALSALLGLLPHHSSDLLSQVDQPLQVLHLSLSYSNTYKKKEATFVCIYLFDDFNFNF